MSGSNLYASLSSLLAAAVAVAIGISVYLRDRSRLQFSRFFAFCLNLCLFHLARFADRVRDMHFLLQKEVVDRMVAKPSTPDYGRLSVMLQVRFAMAKLFEVGPGAFRPPPKVDSAFVRLVPLPGIALPERFADVVRKAFSARRKTLRNALGLSPGDFEALSLDPRLRPENLAPGDYVRVARLLSAARAR